MSVFTLSLEIHFIYGELFPKEWHNKVGLSFNRLCTCQALRKQPSFQDNFIVFYFLAFRSVEPETKGYIRQSPFRKPDPEVNLTNRWFWWRVPEWSPPWDVARTVLSGWSLCHSHTRYLPQRNLMEAVGIYTLELSENRCSTENHLFVCEIARINPSLFSNHWLPQRNSNSLQT